MNLKPRDLALPRDLEQLAGLRATLGDWLDRAGVNGDDRNEIILAAHEAVANGIEHSEGDGELRRAGKCRRSSGYRHSHEPGAVA